MAQVPVVIAGGGPVGLTLALELAWHGIASTVLERRDDVDDLRPRAKTTNVRSMEHFRRLGIAEEIRARAPLTARWNQRATVCTSLDGVELASFDEIFAIRPERDDRFAECGQQIAQPLIEEILRGRASRHPLVTLLTGVEVVEAEAVFVGGRESVRVRCATASTETTTVIEAEYLVGADGGQSIVRRLAGITMEEGVRLPANVNITFTAEGLDAKSPFPTAVHYWVVNPRQQGVLIRLDPDRTWAAMLVGIDDPNSADPQELIARLTGERVDAQVLSTDIWSARMAMANSYRQGRVFLAGDAAHLNPPWGGHGFNTGLGDAVNLGWKIAATLQGWGGDALLDSYEAERRPVAAQTIEVAASNMRAIPQAVLDTLEADPELRGPEAERTRDVVQRAKDSEFHSLGLVLGYSYAGSPIVQHTRVSPRAFDPVQYVPTFEPGARLPHRWLPDGRSVYDLLGDGLTLFARADDPARTRMRVAAGDLGIPFRSVERAPDADAEPLLVRSDGHIAWAGAIDDPAAILDLVRGASPADIPSARVEISA